MAHVLLDTNILILHLLGVEPLDFKPLEVAVSYISVFKLLRYPGLSAAEERNIHELLDNCLKIPVAEQITLRAARLARTCSVAMPDLLIATTALELHLPLITKNVKDFKKIPKLVIQDSIV